jgi:hypothetical protein
MKSRRNARVLFSLLVLAAVSAVSIYVRVSSRQQSTKVETAAQPLVDFVITIPDGPFVLFRNAAPGELFGRLALIQEDGDRRSRMIAPLSCERVYYAAGSGVCMVSDESRLPTRYEAYVFNRSFTRGPAIELTGPPIRARVSPDGRRAAMTVFERGHSYADADFSTKTIVVETSSSRTLADLEEFAVQKDSRPFKAVDFNFWGVTFAHDGDRFFATLKTAGHRYLVEGSIDARRATVVHDDVECPSLSPDEQSIVFKKPLPHGVGWQLHVLDVASGSEHALNQVRRSVDDQVDWYDNSHVVYHDSGPEGTGIWVLSTDGVAPPHLLIPNAYSPAVQR